MISICIIEDLEEIHLGLLQLLSSDSRFQILGSYFTAESAILEIPKLNPQIVLVDIGLPKMNGIDAMKIIRSQNSNINFIMFTIFEDNDQIFDALKAGATGYILKNTEPAGIIQSLIEMSEGGSPMSHSIARKVISSFNSVKDNTAVNSLTPREYEVLQLLSKGYLYKEIAAQLDIAISTVKRHINNIYFKLQVQNKTEAVNLLYGK